MRRATTRVALVALLWPMAILSPSVTAQQNRAEITFDFDFDDPPVADTDTSLCPSDWSNRRRGLLGVEGRPLWSDTTEVRLQPHWILGPQRRDIRTGERARWSFSGHMGDVVEIDVKSDEMDPRVKVTSPSGREISNDDGGRTLDARLGFMLPEDGSYDVEVRGSGRGAFTVSVLRWFAAEVGPWVREGVVLRREPNVDDVGILTSWGVFGFTSWAWRSPGASGFWKFYGRAGENFTLEASSDDFDTTVRVIRCMATVGFDDDGGDGTDSRLRVQLPQNGWYLVEVNAHDDSWRRGTYSLTVEKER